MSCQELSRAVLPSQMLFLFPVCFVAHLIKSLTFVRLAGRSRNSGDEDADGPFQAKTN